jgi:hypothetical protein
MGAYLGTWGCLQALEPPWILTKNWNLKHNGWKWHIFFLKGYGWGGQVYDGLLERYDQAKSFDNFIRPYKGPYKAQKPV